MSIVGMPSVMQTASGKPASAASMIASAPPGGGTKITDALAPVSRRPRATVSNTGQPSWVVPPLPGVTPPTTFVPYACACFRVKRAFAAGQALDEQARVGLIDAVRPWVG